MAQAPNTKSTISQANGTNKTSTGISTNIIIMVGTVAVGAVQSMQIGEKRTIKQIDEVGTDGHVDSVPNASTNITGTCQRVRFDGMRVAEAFNRGFVHVSSQVYPFDIVILDKQKSNAGAQIVTVIKNVWINGIDYTYQVSDWVITESMTWEAERIYSHLGSGSGTSVAVGGERGSEILHAPVNLLGDRTNIEQASDTGARGSGSLDAAGLIDINSQDGGLF